MRRGKKIDEKKRTRINEEEKKDEKNEKRMK